MSDDGKLSREQRIEIYRRLAAAGTRGPKGQYQSELISAARNHDIEMLDALHDLDVDIHDPIEVYQDSEDDPFDDWGGRRHVERKRSHNLLLIAAREKNREMIDYLAAKGLLDSYTEHEKKQTLAFDIQDKGFTEYLFRVGIAPTSDAFKQCLLNELPVDHVKLFLDYGLPINIARQQLSIVVRDDVNTPDYIAEIADLLKLPPAKKPVLIPPAPRFPIEVEAPLRTPPSPDEVIFDRPFLGNRRIIHVFNFVTRERTSAVRRDDFSPVESIETRQFHELRDNPDLMAAHVEHVARGGMVSESDLYRHKKPIKCSVVQQHVV
jgi:hypothetical protein